MFRAYFSFDGRLNRGPFWGYSILLIVIIVIVSLIALTSAVGPELAALVQSVSSGHMPTVTGVTALFQGAVPRLGWIGVIVQIILTIPTAALCVKRRHDRNRSGIDVWIYLGLGIVLSILQVLGIGFALGTVMGEPAMVATGPMQIVQLAMLVFAIYLFIVLAFLRGTVGANTYGPDPLGG
ncbi:MAG: DUF805 domain-containing protein [Devosia sp.]